MNYYKAMYLGISNIMNYYKGGRDNIVEKYIILIYLNLNDNINKYILYLVSKVNLYIYSIWIIRVSQITLRPLKKIHNNIYFNDMVIIVHSSLDLNYQIQKLALM